MRPRRPGHFPANPFDLAALQRRDDIAGDGDRLVSVDRSMAHLNEPFRTPVGSVDDIPTKAILSDRRRRSRDKLPIQPRRGRRY